MLYLLTVIKLFALSLLIPGNSIAVLSFTSQVSGWNKSLAEDFRKSEVISAPGYLLNQLWSNKPISNGHKHTKMFSASVAEAFFAETTEEQKSTPRNPIATKTVGAFELQETTP